MPQRSAQRYERYLFDASPWCQNMTQRDLADLLGIEKSTLESLIDHKDEWIRRRTVPINKKLRDLAYPFGRLRQVHERIKYHMDKIKQPDYLQSPRKGHSQRDNALVHTGQNQFLSLDIRQFYPSTTSEHVFRWAHHIAGLRDDVSGMITHLVTVDGKISFGSPLSPVLTTLVHRHMFDAIYAACQRRGLKMSLWVDDLTVSGRFVPGELVKEIRSVIAGNGFKSHKIQYRTGAIPVIVTGVPIVDGAIAAPRALHDRLRDGYRELAACHGDADRSHQIDRLLSNLGTYRYLVGPSSAAGRQAAGRMNALRQRRAKLNPIYTTRPTVAVIRENGGAGSEDTAPFDA